MDNNTTLLEHKILSEAEDDIALYGKTNRKCPRCGNEIVIVESGNSYTVRCKTDGCIKTDIRGI